MFRTKRLAFNPEKVNPELKSSLVRLYALAKLKQLFSKGKPIPTLILLLGLLLMFDGFYTAISKSTITHWIGTWLEYPFIFQGVLKGLIGFVVVVFGYLLFHGKISYFNTT